MPPSQINPRPKTTPPPQKSLHSSVINSGGIETFAILTFAAAGMAILLALLPAVGHDQLWCLYAAQQILHGTKLYGPELLESNPPLIMGMLLIPVALSNLLGIPATLLFKLGVVTTELVSATVSVSLLRRLCSPFSATRSLSFAFIFIIVFAVLPARDFGQRDHLLVILCLPYVLAAALDFQNAGLRESSPDTRPRTPALGTGSNILIGVMAGVGISLKPHHVLIPILIESALILKHRSLRNFVRPEFCALIAAGAVFLAAIRLITPSYLTDVVPLLRDVYWAIGHLTLPQLIAESLQLHVVAAITVILYLWLRRPQPGSSVPLFLILAGAAAAFAYYLQGTGWYYQQIPALSFFSLALWFLLLELAGRLNLTTPRWTPAAALALSILALVLTAHFSGYTLAKPFSFPSGLTEVPDPAFFSSLPPGTPVAILSTVVDDTVPPIATHHLFWAQRTNNLWALPAILRSEDPQGHPPQRLIPPPRLAELDSLQHLWMVEDLNRWHPALILVLRCEDPSVQCQVLEDRHDNLLAWFQRDPGFRSVFSRYHFIRSSGPYDAYALQ